ncbi:MAG: hypothetical protein ACLFTX_06510 [Thiohalospira sp.]
MNDRNQDAAAGRLIEAAVELANIHDNEGSMTPRAHLLLAHVLDLARVVDGRDPAEGVGHPYDRALIRVRAGQATETDAATLELAVAAARGELTA